MAFGYALMKGRAGAAGYIRETGKAREVMARNIPPRAICYLYRHRNGECDLCGAETADSSGNAKWTAPREGSLFIAADNQVLLWEGSDEAFLLANAWLKNQIKREEKNDKTPEESEGTQDNREVSQEISEIKADSGIVCAKQAKVCIDSDQTKVHSIKNRDKQTEVCFETLELHGPSDTKKQIKETPPGQAYTLRPAGNGEPVDTLPERGET